MYSQNSKKEIQTFIQKKLNGKSYLILESLKEDLSKQLPLQLQKAGRSLLKKSQSTDLNIKNYTIIAEKLRLTKLAIFNSKETEEKRGKLEEEIKKNNNKFERELNTLTNLSKKEYINDTALVSGIPVEYLTKIIKVAQEKKSLISFRQVTKKTAELLYADFHGKTMAFKRKSGISDTILEGHIPWNVFLSKSAIDKTKTLEDLIKENAYDPNEKIDKKIKIVEEEIANIQNIIEALINHGLEKATNEEKAKAKAKAKEKVDTFFATNKNGEDKQFNLHELISGNETIQLLLLNNYPLDYKFTNKKTSKIISFLRGKNVLQKLQDMRSSLNNIIPVPFLNKDEKEVYYIEQPNTPLPLNNKENPIFVIKDEEGNYFHEDTGKSFTLKESFKAKLVEEAAYIDRDKNIHRVTADIDMGSVGANAEIYKDREFKKHEFDDERGITTEVSLPLIIELDAKIGHGVITHGAESENPYPEEIKDFSEKFGGYLFVIPSLKENDNTTQIKLLKTEEQIIALYNDLEKNKGFKISINPHWGWIRDENGLSTNKHRVYLKEEKRKIDKLEKEIKVLKEKTKEKEITQERRKELEDKLLEKTTYLKEQKGILEKIKQLNKEFIQKVFSTTKKEALNKYSNLVKKLKETVEVRKQKQKEKEKKINSKTIANMQTGKVKKKKKKKKLPEIKKPIKNLTTKPPRKQSKSNLFPSIIEYNKTTTEYNKPKTNQNNFSPSKILKGQTKKDNKNKSFLPKIPQTTTSIKNRPLGEGLKKRHFELLTKFFKLNKNKNNIEIPLESHEKVKLFNNNNENE